MLRHWALVAELEELFKAGRVWPKGKPIPADPPPGWTHDTIKSGTRKGHATLRWTGDGASRSARGGSAARSTEARKQQASEQLAKQLEQLFNNRFEPMRAVRGRTGWRLDLAYEDNPKKVYASIRFGTPDPFEGVPTRIRERIYGRLVDAGWRGLRMADNWRGPGRVQGLLLMQRVFRDPHLHPE